MSDNRIQGAYVVEVCVRQDNTADGGTKALRSLDDCQRTACEAGVDEGEAIVFLDQEAIDHAEAREPEEAAGFLNEFHGATE